MTPEMRTMLARVQVALRTTAERDANDIIANAASDLAVRLESVGTTFGTRIESLTSVDRQMIHYALNEQAKREQNLIEQGE